MRPFLIAALLSSALLQGNECEHCCCPYAPKHMRASMRHIEAGGVGYRRGYTTLEGFFATDPNEGSFMPFLDLRGHIFNNGKMAGNAGIGGRTIWGDRAYGANVYYDYRTGHHKGYSQVSGGIETLGKLWDLRFNGYFPVGGKVSRPYKLDFAGFFENSVLVSRKFEYAMTGVDGEVGFHFGKTTDFDFYVAGGAYYFTRSDMGKDAIGGKVRLAAYYKEYVTLEVSNSYDAVFHDNVQGQLTLSLPFGPRTKSKYKDCNSECNISSMILAARMVQPVAKQEIVVLNNRKKKTAASDFIIFVNNESSSNGTFESPYPTLVLAQDNSKPGDIIYVFAGDGTTTGMDAGILLQNNQRLWGSSIAHTLTTNLGTITIPPYTPNPPQITNTGGNGVDLAINNELSGLSITNTSGHGVAGVDPGNLSISQSMIGFAGADGVNLLCDLGTHNLEISEIAVVNNGGTGVNLLANTNDPQVNLSITQSLFTGNVQPVSVLANDNSVVNANLNQDLFFNNSDPVFFRSNSNATTPLSISLSESFITGTTERPVEWTFTSNAPVQASMVGNAITNCVKGPRIVFLNAIDSTLLVSGNTFSTMTGADGLSITNTNPSLLATVQGNAFTNNNQSGLLVDNASGTLCLELVGNASSGNGVDPYQLNQFGGTFNLTPCNYATVNSGNVVLLGVTPVESCESGIPCPP